MRFLCRIAIHCIPLFLFACADINYTPYDSQYRGDYTFDLQIPQKTLSAFVPYSFYYTCGKDTFNNFTVSTSPSGHIDTSFFILKLKTDSVGLYFTHPFSGALYIIGKRPNQIADTFSFPVSVLNPFRISQQCTNSDEISLSVISPGNQAIESVKKILWFTNSTPVDTLTPGISLNVPLYSRKPVVVTAELKDWLENSLLVPSCTLITSTTKPQVQTSILNASCLFLHDTIRFSSTVISQKNDTGTLFIINHFDTVSFPLVFSRNDTIRFGGNAGIAAKEGTFLLDIIYINKKGISSSRLTLYANVLSSFLKQTINAVQIKPEHVYQNEPVEISVLTTNSPSGQKFQTFYWDTTGDSIWDIITAKPSLSLTFTTDTASIAIRCSDSSGFLSDIFHTILPVDSGIPVIDEIRLPQSPQYSNKSFDIEIRAHDNPGGSIDSYKVFLTDSEKDTLLYQSKSSILSLTVDTAQCGIHTVSAMVRDHSGHWSKPCKHPATLSILSGYPEISDLYITDTAWYLKPVRLYIDAVDYNGIIKTILIDWDDSCIDTIELNTSHVTLDNNHLYSKHPEKTLRNVEVSICDNENHKTRELLPVYLHSGMPSVSIRSSSITCVSNDTVYIQNIVHANKLEFIQLISLYYTSSDSNGLPLYYYCDIDSPYSYTFNDAEGFTVRSDSMRFTYPFDVYSYSVFSSDSPAVKSVLFCIDNDGLIGTDTFYIRTYTLPPISIIQPTEDYPVNRSGFSVVWRGGVDQFLILDTKYRLTIKSNYDQFTNSYITMSQYTGRLRDVVTSESPFEFTFKVDPDRIPASPQDSSILLQLEIFDRLGQITSTSVLCTLQQ